MKSSKHTKLVARKFQGYCEHATLHGVFYFHSPNSWFTVSIWCTIIAFSTALCIFLSHMIWQKFVTDPTITVVESINYPIVNVHFPAVAICDPLMVYGPNAKNITDILTRRGYNIGQVEEFYKSFANVAKREYAPEAYIKKMHSALEDLGYTYLDLIEMTKNPCESIIVSCIWRSEHHNCSAMFREIYTIMGFCCQFDVNYFKKHARGDTNFISGLLSTEALDFTVDGLQTTNSEKIVDTAFRMYLFDEQNSLTPLVDFVLITSGTYFDVVVDAWTIESSEDVNSLPRTSRKCLLKTDTDVPGDFGEVCMTNIMLAKSADYCKCLPFNYTASQLSVDDYSACSWERYICIHRMFEKAQTDIDNLDSQNMCYQKCDYIQYDTKVDYIKRERLSNATMFTEHQSRVTVHFSDTTCIKYRREVLYTWDQMLANLGGVFGLCLGGSVISVVEIIWIILDMTYTVLVNIGNRKKRLKNINKFSLNQKEAEDKNSKIVYPFKN